MSTDPAEIADAYATIFQLAPDVYRCTRCLEFSNIPGKCYLCGGKKEAQL